MVASTGENGTETWDRLYEVLAAQPRRMIVFSLLKAPEKRRLPLPDAAQTPGGSADSEGFRIRLRHHHLPKLSDPGYVRWERDPFSVRRGPHFQEPALVVSRLTECSDDYPPRLRDECVVVGEVEQNDPA